MIKLSDIKTIALNLSTLAPFTGSNFSGRPGNANTDAMGSHILGWGEHIKESAAAAIYTVWSYNTVIGWTADGTNWTILADNPGQQTTAKHMSAFRQAVAALEGSSLTEISKNV